MKNFMLIFLSGFLVYFGSFMFVYFSGLNTLPIQSEDTVPAMFIPVTLLKEGTFYADTYYDMMLDRYPHPDDRNGKDGLVPFYIKRIQSNESAPCQKLPAGMTATCFKTHYVTAFTLTPGILATPVYLPALLAGMQITWENLILLSHMAAALIMSFSGGFMYILLKKHFFPQPDQDKKAIFLTSIYLFATVNFAMLSQSLWQHGALQLFTIAGLIFLLNALKNQKPAHFALFGFFLSLAVITRPTAALFAVLLYLLIPLTLKKQGIKPTIYTFLGVLPVVAFFVWYTLVYYGGFSNNGYASQMGNSWISPLWEGFLGIWVSPSKGILIYSPVLFFSLVGAYKAFKNKSLENRPLFLLSVVIIVLHTLVMGKWKHWFGGFSFGYRLASDVLPFFIILLASYVLSDLYARTRKVFYVLFAFSVGVQLMGMVFFDGIWHNAYDMGFKDTRWLWSLQDSEAAFNVRRVLVKSGYLERACPECLPN